MNQENNQKPNTANAQSPISKEKISFQVREKTEAVKLFIERKYTKLKQNEQENKQNWDLLQRKMQDLNLSVSDRDQIKHDILQKESQKLRKKRQKITIKDYEPLTIIGRGAFGEVRLCRNVDTSEVVAIKKMKKNEMLFKNQVTHVRAERDVLSSSNNPWIVQLKSSFQDSKHLYLVMEYLGGGDLMTLLMKKDILSEEEAKFYIAEAILAVDSVHKLDYVHRDLKPDNILIDSKGHIKLSDFGLCKHMEIKPIINFGKSATPSKETPNLPSNELNKKPWKRNRQMAFSTVGTPDYIAPEVFQQNGYNETADWWSLGVILFEMLVGYPPFFSEEPSLTCQKILHWKKTFLVPHEAKLSYVAIDLIRKFIAEPNERLGVNGVEEIKAHPFFAGIDWKRIREKPAPYVPELKNAVDTANFDKFEEEEPWFFSELLEKKNRKNDVNFIGYTFKRDTENERSEVVTALENLERNRYLHSKQTNENLENYPPNNDKTLVNPHKSSTKSPLAKGNLHKALSNFQNNNAKNLINLYNNNNNANNKQNIPISPINFNKSKEVSPINIKRKVTPLASKNMNVNKNNIPKATYNSKNNIQLALTSMSNNTNNNYKPLKKLVNPFGNI